MVLVNDVYDISIIKSRFFVYIAIAMKIIVNKSIVFHRLLRLLIINWPLESKNGQTGFPIRP